jgi:transposase
MSFVHLLSVDQSTRRGGEMRSFGPDIHRDFCEVAIAEAGEIRSPGRIEMTPAALGLFAGSLGPGDQVALELSGNAREVSRIIRPHMSSGW